VAGEDSPVRDGMRKVSVIVVAYNKFENFEQVLAAWLAQPEVNDVIVLDNSGRFRTDLPVLVVSVSENLWVQGKFPLAFWAKNNCVMLFDDDILPLPGLVADFLKYWNGHRLLSLLGRTIGPGDSYYGGGGRPGSHGRRAGRDVFGEPVKVDWVGAGACMVHRRHCAVNVREAPNGAEDLWWEAKLRGKLEFLVIPTDRFRMLPEQEDPKKSIHLGSYFGGYGKWKVRRERYAREFGFIK